MTPVLFHVSLTSEPSALPILRVDIPEGRIRIMAPQVLPDPYMANDTDSDRSPTNGVIPWMNLRIPLVVLLRNLSGELRQAT